jgi:GNAT superfamily N-acetyltransferase
VTKDPIIRSAVPSDAPAILHLVRSLAEYEKLLDQVEATSEDLAKALFCEAPRVFCDIAERGGRPVGFALWFYNFSTFLGRPGLYLEDLFVEPEHRAAGIGKALIARLARRCVEEGLGRLEWSVLDWNAPAIRFYEACGAVVARDWRQCRLAGVALRAMASGDDR